MSKAAVRKKKEQQQQQRLAQHRHAEYRQQVQQLREGAKEGKVASLGASEQPSLRLSSPDGGSMPNMPNLDAIGEHGKLGSSMDYGPNHAVFCSLGNPEFDDPPRCRTPCKLCDVESLVKEEDVTRLGGENKSAASTARKCKHKEAVAVENEKIAVQEAKAAEAAATRAAEKALEMKAAAAVAKRRAEEATRALNATRIAADLASRKWVRGRDALAEVLRVEIAHRRAEKMQKRSEVKKEKAAKVLKPTWEDMQLKRSIVARLIYETMSTAFHKIDTTVDDRVTLEEWVKGYDSVKHHGLDGEPFVALASVESEEIAKAVFEEMTSSPDVDGGGGGDDDDNLKGERVILLDRWCEYLKDAEVAAKSEIGLILHDDDMAVTTHQEKVKAAKKKFDKNLKRAENKARQLLKSSESISTAIPGMLNKAAKAGSMGSATSCSSAHESETEL